MFCYKHNLHKFLTLLRSGALHANSLTSSFKHLPQWVINLLISKMSFWILGLASGLSLFVEEKRRRGELAMYVLPKGLESIWVMARGKGLVFRTGKWGDVILAALGMAMVMVNEFFWSKKKQQNVYFFFFYQKYRARIRMIPNIFRDWLGEFYINSSGLISGSDIIRCWWLVTGEKKTSPAKQTTEVMHIPKQSDTTKWHWNIGKWNFSGFSFFFF